jgi:hypothetical protein
MKDARHDIEARLKEVVVPALRARGFRGSFPHFRRVTETGVDLLTFQFRLGGGSFVVEAAYKAPYRVTSEWGSHVPPEKLTAHDVNKRKRIGRAVLGSNDPWFDFSSRDHHAISDQVCASFVEADAYWSEMRAPNSEGRVTR